MRVCNIKTRHLFSVLVLFLWTQAFLALALLFTPKVWATPYTVAYWDAGQAAAKFDRGDLDANNESHAKYEYTINDNYKGEVEAHLTAEGLEISLFSQNYSARASGSGGAWTKAFSEVSDEFMIQNTSQAVDAILNFRLDGDVYLPKPDPGYLGWNQIRVSLDIFNSDYSYELEYEDRLRLLDVNYSGPGVISGFRSEDDFGVPIVLDGNTYKATFSNVPLSFDLTGLPLNETLEYRLTLMNDIVNFGLTDFRSTLTFDADEPIVLLGDDGTYTLTSTTGSFGLGESTGTGYQIILGQGPGPTPVPEPATMLLLGFGLIGLTVFGRRFRK